MIPQRPKNWVETWVKASQENVTTFTQIYDQTKFEKEAQVVTSTASLRFGS